MPVDVISKNINPGPQIRPIGNEDSGYSILKVVGVISIILMIFAVVYLVLPKSKDCGNDVECFTEVANNCESGVMWESIGDGTLVKYETSDCVLTKYFYQFSDSEPIEVTEFFGDKKMTCQFSKGGFDPYLATGLAFGVDSCEGELKEAIIELRLAQLSLQG